MKTGRWKVRCLRRILKTCAKHSLLLSFNISLFTKQIGCFHSGNILFVFCIRYKPSSVPLSRPLSFIYDCGHPQPLATYPPTLDEQPLIVGIRGLATHETHSRVYCYPRGGLLPRLLTLTLAGGYFLLRYYTLTNIKPLTCVVLCVARTFLPHPKVAAIERKCGAKIVKKVKTENWKLKSVVSATRIYKEKEKLVNLRSLKRYL